VKTATKKLLILSAIAGVGIYLYQKSQAAAQAQAKQAAQQASITNAAATGLSFASTLITAFGGLP